MCMATVPSVESNAVVALSAGGRPATGIWRLARGVGRVIAVGYGCSWLLTAGTVAAALPVGNWYVLGWLLEGQSRIARRRGSIVLWAKAGARLGSIVLGSACWLAPVALLASIAADAQAAAPGTIATWSLWGSLIVLGVVAALVLWIALLRGGRLAWFFRPWSNARWLRAQFAATAGNEPLGQTVIVGLRQAAILERTASGMAAYLGVAAWLCIPVTLLTFRPDDQRPASSLARLAGGIALAAALGWAPLLQALFADQKHPRALLAVGAARRLFRQAPIAWTIAIASGYALSIPYYFYLLHLKLRLPPHDGRWDLSLIILLGMLPARLLAGWAHGRSLRQGEAHKAVVWGCRIVLWAGLAAFVWMLAQTPQLLEHGARSLYEHHSLVTPLAL